MRLNTDPRVLKPPRQKKGVFPVPVSFFSELFFKVNTLGLFSLNYRRRYNLDNALKEYEAEHGPSGIETPPAEEGGVSGSGKFVFFKHMEAFSTLVESLVQMTCSDLTKFFKLAKFAI